MGDAPLLSEDQRRALDRLGNLPILSKFYLAASYGWPASKGILLEAGLFPSATGVESLAAPASNRAKVKTMSSSGRLSSERFPVDVRLVAPESRYEIEDGKVVYVSPADEPHASRHSKISAIVEAHAQDGYDVASDMLTRLTETDDAAPDVSVFPFERDAKTGGRQIEELAFEVVSTERLGHAGKKAAKLVARGVRRVFAIDVERQRALEWSRDIGNWAILPDNAQIEDRALALALPIEALVRAAKSDDAVARALLAKHNPVLRQALDQRAESGRIEGKAEALLVMLHARGLVPTEEERLRLHDAGAQDIDRWLARALTCSTVNEIFG